MCKLYLKFFNRIKILPHCRGTHEPRSADLRQRAGHSGLRNDVRARQQTRPTAAIFAQYLRCARISRNVIPCSWQKRNLDIIVLNNLWIRIFVVIRTHGGRETAFPLAQGATLNDDVVFLGIASRYVPSHICHRRIYLHVNLYLTSIIFIISRAIHISLAHELFPTSSLSVFLSQYLLRLFNPWMRAHSYSANYFKN